MATTSPEALHAYQVDAFQQQPGMDATGGMDPHQLQYMQAMMSMLSVPPMADPSGLGAMPQLDPNVFQTYMQMVGHLQAQQQGLVAPGAMPGMLPPAPLASPYASQPMEPSISVSVEGMKFQYQLTEDDLQKVFSRYGKVKQIKVDEAGSSAIICFLNMPDAKNAMDDLNGKVLNGLEGTLRIFWAMPGALPGQPQPQAAIHPYPSMQMPFNPWGFPPAAGAPWPGAAGAAPGAPAGIPLVPQAPGMPGAMDADISKHGKGIRKYTCRFLIGIENDKEFQVARRIIGAKGVNMKRIFKQTDAKLRLRGKGSGYFEGAGQKESSEPLQLCISCTSGDGYKNAVQQCEELLKRLYEEYKQFCRDAGRRVPDVEINLSENQLVYSRGAVNPPGDDEEDDYGEAAKEKSKRGRRSRKQGEDKATDGSMERGEPGPHAPPEEEIEKLIDERNEARRACNFAEADRIRELLTSRGVALMDEPGGRGRGTEVTTWRYWRD